VSGAQAAVSGADELESGGTGERPLGADALDAGRVRGSDEQPVGIDELLERVREGYERIEAQQAHDAHLDGDALLVDIRYAALRERDGLIPGALVVERNELEWRLDPRGSHRAPEATSHDLRVVVICNEGYASSLAAASLHQLGLRRATDLVGGFQAWKAAGLPVTR
jgi:rhodanese-related sulfurtransferase